MKKVTMKKIFSVILALLMVLGTTAFAGDERLDIPVICYHSVSDNPLNLSTYRISDDEFIQDMEYYTAAGYRFIKPCEMWYAQEGSKNIVLTFDDGYEDFYEVVFPILKQYNAKAAVYVIGSEIDKTGYLKSWQIKEMDDSGLVEIGNHTTIVHNYGWTREDLLNDDMLVTEFIEDVKDCSNRIYRILGHGTESIAYPSGQYTDKLDEILRTNLGYTTTITTDYGTVKTRADILKPIKRIYRVHNDTPQGIAAMIESCNK